MADVFIGLKQVTKTVADKILKELGESKIIGMHSTNKEHKGSQFVFWTLQVRLLARSFLCFPCPSPSFSYYVHQACLYYQSTLT